MPFYGYFLITLALELPLVLFFFRKNLKLALITGLLLNFFTWPLLHLILYLTKWDVNLLELAVATTEAIGYLLLLQCRWYKAFLVSFAANAFSYLFGLLLTNCILL